MLAFFKYCNFWIDILGFLIQTSEPAPPPRMFSYGVPPWDETHNMTNDFITTVTSNSFLPYVLQPIRVTDHSFTVIDNIFSNITDFETTSGNITTMIADYFAQFLILKKFHVDIKSNLYFTYDCSKFGKEKLICDFSLLDWPDLDDMDKSITLRTFTISH